MTNTPYWTQEDLLDQALELIDMIVVETDPDEAEKLDKLFMIITDDADGKQEKETDEIPSVRH